MSWHIEAPTKLPVSIVVECSAMLQLIGAHDEEQAETEELRKLLRGIFLRMRGWDRVRVRIEKVDGVRDPNVTEEPKP